MTKSKILTQAALRAGTALSAMGVLALVASPAWAQSTTAQQSTSGEETARADEPEVPVSNSNVPSEDDTIVVTGTLFRSTTNATPSPVTVLTSEALDQRGVTTTQEGIQRLASNNGPAITTSFTANGAFAAGSSAVSLRGLTTNSTLVLFDGMRASYYPLADDAVRNFVDLNTIPDDIVDRVEVLRDGASSTYGADAIAGVVNIITKKEIKGLSGRVEYGIDERGDAPSQRASLTAGWGDLDDNGVNAYVSGFYYHQDGLLNRDRPYPYNTLNQSGICKDGVCGPANNGTVINPLDSNGNYTGFQTGTINSLFATTFFVAPYDATNTTAQGRYQFLNPAAGCITDETPLALTPADLAADPLAPSTVCQGDLIDQYGSISPEVKRWGVSARATARITDSIEAFFQGNFLQSRGFYDGGPATFRANGQPGIFFPRFSTAASGGANAPGSFVLALPVYICPLVQNRPDPSCNALNPNAQLNPNNPFAAQGQVARILGRIPNISQYNETKSRAYRAAAGVTGPVFGDWNFSVDAVAMRTDLDRIQKGYIYIQQLLNAVADGSYNFRDPFANTQARIDTLAPENLTKSNSQLYSAQASVGGPVFQLPGGPVELGVGAQIRYESIDAPSANPDPNGPTERYLTINAFGTKGNRTVKSVYAELNAPIVKQVTVNVSGRYDSYSSGQSAFSPKIGVKFQPIRQLALRGTYSKGFRIPSFAETNALPTTGFVSNQATIFNDGYLAQYGCTVATFSTACPAYLRSGTYGLTTLATQSLDPEKSRSFTAGVIFEPIRNITFTADYYNIKKTGAITTPSSGPAIAAYYNNQPIPAGFNIIADAADPNNPTARPKIAFVQASLINSDTVRSEGIDFSINTRMQLGSNIRWSSFVEASYIINLDTTFPSGVRESYEGTLGNFNLTAGSGTPEWRGSWQNTFEIGRLTLTGVADYYDGYNLSAEDQGGVSGDCGLLGSPFVSCDVDSYITFDVIGSYDINDKLTVYGNVINVFDKLPPIDPVTYGATNYNPVQGGTGIYGRVFRAGLKFKLGGDKPTYVAPPAPPPPPPPPAPPPATQTCADGSVILASDICPPPPAPPPPPPPAPAPERG